MSPKSQRRSAYSMDREMIKMSERDRKKFEEMLAIHSAPTLLGVKCANLFAIKQTEISTHDIEMYFKSQKALNGLSVRCLCRCNSRALLYVYHKALLEMWLSDERVADFLENYGYLSSLDTNEKLDLLEKRISANAAPTKIPYAQRQPTSDENTTGAIRSEAQCVSFPHEIGIFLGYPVDDVLGFIENEGANYLFCGFWKVYSNPEGAQKAFDDYVYCRQYLCNTIKHGVDLYSAVENFRRN